MEKIVYDVFICYNRNSGLDTARRIHDLLIQKGYSVTYNYNTTTNKPCDKKQLSRIEQCSDFILIVDKNAFTRTLDPGTKPEEDWFRQELSYALKLKKNIISVLLAGAIFPSKLPEDINSVKFSQSLKRNYDSLDSFFLRLNEYMYSLPRNYFVSQLLPSINDRNMAGVKKNDKDIVKYDVFLSYSRKDYFFENGTMIPDNEVSRIMEALTEAGITYWIDQNGIYGGNKFTEKIPFFIKSSLVFVFLSSSNANASKHTSKEVSMADDEDKVIIPVRLDSTPYGDKVNYRIADFDRIDYWQNPEEGRVKLVQAIKKTIEEINVKKKEEKEAQKRREEDLERQRRQQEAERIKQERITKIESSIAAEKERKEQQEKLVFQKQHELDMAKLDLKTSERQIEKLLTDLSKIYGEDDETFAVGDVFFKMVFVEGKTFMMGNKEGSSDEEPMHLVTLDNYQIGETVVTQALWMKIMETTIKQQRNKANPLWPLKGEGDDYPMYYVSWNECKEFIERLNNELEYQLRGRKFRLPTEAEWEYAALGGIIDSNYSGSESIDDVAWYKDNSGKCSHPVKKKKGNGFGLYDMSGNVWEWCNDWYGDYIKEKQTNPQGPSTGSFRVTRGGSWRVKADNCRASYRNYEMPNNRNVNLGFRLVL